MIKDLKICGISDPKTLNFILNHPFTPKFVGFITNYEDSKRYVAYENLKNLVNESQTPKGLNEQGVKELTKAGFYRSLEKALNSIHRRLNK